MMAHQRDMLTGLRQEETTKAVGVRLEAITSRHIPMPAKSAVRPSVFCGRHSHCEWHSDRHHD